MYRQELAPTQENIINTFLADPAERSNFAVDLFQILQRFDTGISIAIDGAWGSGKTFSIKQAKMLIDVTNENSVLSSTLDGERKEAVKSKLKELYPKSGSEIIPQIAVYYDAWANDNSEEPVLSIIYEVLRSLNYSEEIYDEKLNIFHVVSDIADTVLGSKFLFNTHFRELSSDLQRESLFKSIQKEKSLEEKIRELFASLLIERAERLVIFVDELDRCRPDYAIRLLERIKHYFSCDRVSFVFIMNGTELKKSIRHVYASDFDADLYLERFFDLIIPNPDYNAGGIVKYMWNMVSKDDYRYEQDKIVINFIKAYHLEMRQIAKFIQRVEETSVKNIRQLPPDRTPSGIGIRAISLYIPTIGEGLKIINKELYEQYMQGKNADPLLKVLVETDPDYASFLLERFGGPGCKIPIEDMLLYMYDRAFHNTPPRGQRPTGHISF